jgi:NAD(P)-dependent dehydrogenase (short-subunit alcohol dehydrogenase family)
MDSTQTEVILRRFETPDDVREMVKGRFEIVRLGGLTIGRATYQPGWKWSEHVGPAVGASRCTVEHVGLVLRTWTTDLKNRRIRSNVVSPGPINTPLASRQSVDVIARIVSTVPMGRMGEPEEVAKAALFLASDDSSFITGIELFVDGGRAQV